LGWQPTVPLKEGLQLTVEDFRTRIGDRSLQPISK